MSKRAAAAVVGVGYLGLVIATTPVVAGVRMLLARDDLAALAGDVADSTITYFEEQAEGILGLDKDS